MEQLLSKINSLKPWQVAWIVVGVGLGVFFTGLANQFQNDDTFQIVNNPPAHSITNLPLLFQSGTYWDGQRLTGYYYRPMMSAVFALIYTFVGAHPVAYHIVQLSLYIASAFLLYLVFRHFFKTAIALPLALIFLVHPLNSQIVYSIATMQDALFFLFGILAVWLLIHYKSAKSLWAVSACLFFALLSKEAGLAFVAMALLYLFWFDRERLRAFLGTLIVPVVLYLVLRVHAVGLSHQQITAPIDSLSLIGRLFTAPSIVLFYIGKLMFPWRLATTYYWTYPKLSVAHVLLPLIIDIAAVGLFVYLGIRVRNKLAKSKFQIYCFFAAWTALGIILYLQIVPLDMTACTTWFYFAMAGLLGMAGVALLTVKIHVQPVWLLVPVVFCIGLLGSGSALRGRDFQSQYTTAVRDLAASQDDFTAMNSIATHLIDQGNYKEAAKYAQRSINVYPVVANYNLLGVALEQSGDYRGAVQAYNRAVQYGGTSTIYENLGLILLVYSDPASASQFFQKALTAYPHSFKLWLYFAIFEGATGSDAGAKAAIATAAQYGSVPPSIYNNIMNNQLFPLPLLGKTLLVR